MQYIENLIQNCELAKTAKPIKDFVLEDLNQLDGIKSGIYIIEQNSGNENQAFEDFVAYKKLKERACAKANAPSSVMYVGSSTTGIKKRIQQHLGDGNKGTYSLQLKYWFSGDVKIRIKTYDVSRDGLQIIEDSISHDLRPAFGKQGGNNK